MGKLLTLGNFGFVTLGFVLAILYLRAAHRSRMYDLVQWLIGQDEYVN